MGADTVGDMPGCPPVQIKRRGIAPPSRLVPMVRNAIAPAQDAEVIDSMQFRGYKSLLFKNRESATT